MKYIYLICILFHTSVQAQINPGPRSISMGSAGVALQDIWSLQQNPAGAAGIEKPIFAIGYEQHFLNQDLSTQTALFAFPYRQDVFGLSFQRYGFSDYHEQRTGFTYSRRFGNSLYAAIGFNYHHIEVAKYGSAQTFSAEVGLQYQATEKLWIASHIANPNGSRYDDLSESTLPVSISFGASYRFSDKVLISSDIQKVLSSTVDVKLGLEYKLIEWFSLRGGISASPFKQYGGFGLSYERFCLEVASSSHPNLGFSPQIAISYEF